MVGYLYHLVFRSTRKIGLSRSAQSTTINEQRLLRTFDSNPTIIYYKVYRVSMQNMHVF